MDAYSTVFGERYQSQLEKEAGIRAMFKGVGRGLKQTMDQSAATSLVKKRRKATNAWRNTRDQQQAMFQQAQDTLDAAKSKSGLGRLWGNIKGNYLHAKAEGLSDKMGGLSRRINRYDNKLGNNAFYQARQNKVMSNRTALENARNQQAPQQTLNFGDGTADVHYAQTPVTAGNITGAQQVSDGIVTNIPTKIPAAAAAPAAPAAQVANKALNGGGGFSATFDNASDAMSGSMGTVSDKINLNKKLRATNPRNATVDAGTTQQGQTSFKLGSPANAATTKAQTKAVASDTMNGAAPAPVKGQPAAPQPTAPKGDAAPAQATAPQPTAPKGKGAAAPDAAPDTTQPTAPQPTAPKKPAKPDKSTPPAKPTQPADPDLPPIPQGGAPQGGVPQQGMMTPQGYMPQGMMTPQGYMQPYPFAMQAPQQGMSTSEKLMMAGMLGNLSMPAYMYMMSRNNDD